MVPIAVLLLILFRTNQFKATVANSDAKNTNTNLVVDNEQGDNSNFDQSSIDTAKLQIPIFMYHYIRDLADQNDTIGQGLSVSPSILAGQLDQIKELGYTTINFSDLEKGNLPEKPIILTFDDGYQDFFDNAFPQLKKTNNTATVFVIAKRLNDEYVTKEEIKSLSSQRIEIGSHTLNHPDLTKISAERMLSEISESKTILENITGEPVISFCYPAGKYSEPISLEVKNAGYHFAVTTKPGIADLADSFELKRYRITNESNLGRILK